MKLKKYEIPSKAKESLKALVISDIHYVGLQDNDKLERILEVLKNNKYDVIYLGGDIIDSTNVLHFNAKATYKILAFIKDLGVIAPTYIAYGANDLVYYSIYGAKYLKEPYIEDIKTFMNKFLEVVSGFKNIYVVENTPLVIKEGYTLSIINPSLDYVFNNPKGDPEIINRDKISYSFLRYLDKDKTNTLICHYPEFILTLYKLDLLGNIDLSIAGHDHNGLTQMLPIEVLLNLMGQKNRGLITPSKSIRLKNTNNLRGKIELDSDRTLIINPAVTTVAERNDNLKKIDSLFYEGASEITYVPEEEIKRVRKRG